VLLWWEIDSALLSGPTANARVHAARDDAGAFVTRDIDAVDVVRRALPSTRVDAFGIRAPGVRATERVRCVASTGTDALTGQSATITGRDSPRIPDAHREKT